MQIFHLAMQRGAHKQQHMYVNTIHKLYTHYT